METAVKILILGGVLNIAYGLLTGIPAGMIRSRQPDFPKYLRFVHIGALMWGPILISLSLAVTLSPLDTSIETLAAVLVIAASILLDAKDTLNWLQGVKDEFAEKPRLPMLLGGLSSLAGLVGTAIIILGVLQAM